MRRLHLAIYGLLMIAAGAGVWYLVHDPIAVVYIWFAMLAVLVVVSKSPKPEWIGSGDLDEAEEHWAEQTIGERCKRPICRFPLKVKDLDTYTAVDRYFSTVVNGRSSDTLCKEVNEAFFDKAVAYIFAAFGMVSIAYVQSGKHETELVSTGVKVVTAFAIFGVPALIDVAKLRFQAKLNEEASLRKRAAGKPHEGVS